MTITLSQTEKALLQKHLDRRGLYLERANAAQEFVSDLVRAFADHGGIPPDARVTLDVDKWEIRAEPEADLPPSP